MKHIPEGVIQVPESPDARKRCRGVVPFLMMTCAPGVPSALPSRRNQSVQTEYRQWHLPSVCDRNGYAYGCPEFQPNTFIPDITGSHGQ